MLALHERTAPADEASRLTRRLDWRFLLPEPHLRRVIHVGRPACTLARALDAFSESVVAADGPGVADLVVGQGATRDQLEAVLPRLASGGSLYWELPSGHTPGDADVDWLAQRGVSQVRMFWHSPGFEDQRWIVPLDHAGGPAMLLKRRLPTVSPRLLQKSVELLMRSPMVRRRLAISLIGRRGPIGHTGTFAHRFAGLQGVPRPYLVATPSFPSSRTVVFLMEPGASHEPTLVAKIARVEGGAEALRREADNLRAVHRDCETVEAPRLRAHAIFDRHAVVLESAVPGRLMQPRIVRRAPAVCIDAVMRWLEDLHRATRMPASDAPGRVMTLIESPLARLEPIVAHDPWAQELLLRVRRVTSRLASPGLPLVFEHGDLSSPNLLIQPDGRAGVLDWELAHPHGLPAVDLFFFLAFVAFARERATTPDECVNAFRQAFFGPSAWARPYIERYAALVGVPTPALRPLFLLCWSRYLAQLPDRMAWAVGRGLGPAELADVRRDRYWHLWKYAVEHCDAFE